jgi:heat-inducible transcriptional repressor
MQTKKPSRNEREKQVLLGLIELYLETGKPIGSNTLKEAGFEHLSSATIRNYFANLEEDGYLVQHHASGGRVPTDLAFKLYALNYQDSTFVSKEDQAFVQTILEKETKQVSSFLLKSIEALSQLTGCPALLLAPRFDQDFITSVKLVQIDPQRALCAIVTDFGMVHSEILFTPIEFNVTSLQKIERYFSSRLKGEEPDSLNKQEEQFATHAYNEVILRHVIHYTNFQQQDIYRTGFSKLLNYPEFQDVSSLATTLSLFENTVTLRTLLKEAFTKQAIAFWIGRDLTHYALQECPATLITIPYSINHKVVGAIALLGPQRIDYKQIFALLKLFAKLMSDTLTDSLYKFKISYRQPETSSIDLKTNTDFSYENTTRFLLEEKQ